MLEIFKFQIIISFFVDYNQEAKGEKWYPDKQNKQKKKSEGSIIVDPNVPTGNRTIKYSS